MSDVRIRLAVVILLSLAAFTGGLGTLFAAVCWIFFCTKETFARVSWKLFVPVTILAAGFPGLILSLTGGEGGIYAAKILVMLAFAFWFGAAQKPGEFLDLGVWALGRKTGFDLGLAAELSLQFLTGIADDLAHMKHALRIKGQKLSVATLPPLVTGLLLLSLARANHAAHTSHAGGTGEGEPMSRPFPRPAGILCCSAPQEFALRPVSLRRSLRSIIFYNIFLKATNTGGSIRGVALKFVY